MAGKGDIQLMLAADEGSAKLIIDYLNKHIVQRYDGSPLKIKIGADYNKTYSEINSTINKIITSMNGRSGVPKIKIGVDTSGVVRDISNAIKSAPSSAANALTLGAGGGDSNASLKQTYDLYSRINRMIVSNNSQIKSMSDAGKGAGLSSTLTSVNDKLVSLQENLYSITSGGKQLWHTLSKEELSAMASEVSRLNTVITDTKRIITEMPAGTGLDFVKVAVIDADSMATKFSSLVSIVESVGNAINNSFGNVSGNASGNSAQNLVSAYNEIKSIVDNMGQNEGLINQGNIDSVLSKIYELNQEIIKYNENMLLTKGTTEFNKAISDLDSYSKKFTYAAEEVEKLRERLNSGKITLGQFKKELADIKTKDSISKLKKDMEAFAAKTPSARNAINDLIKKLNEAGNDSKKIEGISKSFEEIQRTSSGASAGLSSFDRSLASIGSRYFSVFAIFGKLKELMSSSVEFDKYITELQIVSGASDKAIESIKEQVLDMATAIGVAADDLAKSVTTFSRLGYSLNESFDIATLTSKLQQVGGIEASDAQDAITAIIKAFDIDTNDLEGVMDKLVTIGNNYPISVSQLATAINNSSSVLSVAGNSLDEAVAILMAANTTVQDASKASTAVRTLTARIRNTTAELNELGEDPITTSKYENMVRILTDNNVHLRELNGEYRSTYSIMSDIADIWKSLDSSTQAALTTTLAATRGQDVFTSLVTNFDSAKQAFQDMQNSQGTLESAYDKYLNSVNGKIEQLKNMWLKLGTNLFDSTSIKGLTAVAQAIMFIGNALSYLIKFSGGFGGVVSAIIAITSRKIINGFVSLGKNIASIGTMFKSVKTSADAAALSVNKISVAEKASVILTVISLVVQLGFALYELGDSFGVFDSADDKMKNAQESIKNINNEVKEITDEYRKNTRDIDTYIQRYEELSGGVNSLGENVSLSKEEFDEYHDVVNGIASIFPELSAGTDMYGNSILKLSTNTEKAISTLRQLSLLLSKNANSKIAAKAGDIIKNINKEIEASRSSAFGENNMSAGNVNEVRKILSSELATYGKVSRETMQTQNGQDVLNFLRYSANLKEGVDFSTGEDRNIIELLGDAEKQEATRTVILRALNDQLKLEKSYYKDLIPSMNAYLMTLDSMISLDSKSETSGIINAFSKMFGEIDWSEIGDGTESGYKNWINNVVEGVSKNESIAEKIISVFKIDPSELSAKEYADSLKPVFDDIGKTLQGMVEDGTIDFNTKNVLMNAIVSTTDYSDIVNNYTSATSIIMSRLDEMTDLSEKDLNKTKDEFKDFLGGLSSGDLELAVRVLTDNEDIKNVNDLKNAITEFKIQNSEMVDVYDFSGLFEGLENIGKAADKAATSMRKLMDGTALTKQEIFELIQAYPELLKSANLFTDGSISGQKNLLGALLNTYEAQYDANIDTQIKKLKAEKVAVQNQIDLETEKLRVLNEIEADGINDKVTSQEFLNKKMEELGNLEGKSYVDMENGKLKANTEFVKLYLDQEADGAKQSSDKVWAPLAGDIATYHSLAGTNSLKALGDTFSRTAALVKANASSIWNAYANVVTQALQGKSVNTSTINGVRDGMSGSGAKVSVGTARMEATDINKEIKAQISSGDLQKITNTLIGALGASGVDASKYGISKLQTVYGGFEIGDKTLSEWVDNSREIISERLEALQAESKSIEIAIANLEALKGLKLQDLYGKDPSGSKGNSGSGNKSNTKKEESEFEALYKYHQHLLKMDQEEVSDYILWLDEAYKEAYADGKITLDDYYKYSEEVYSKLQELVKDMLGDVEHEISMRTNYTGENKKILQLYKTLLSDIEKEIKRAREQGLDDTDSYVQDLQSKWQSYTDSIKSLQDNVTDGAKKSTDKLIDYRISMIKKELEDLKESNEKKLSELKDFYEKQKKLLKDEMDEEDYIEEQASKRKAVSDIRLQLSQLELDNSAWAQKRRLELQEELLNAEKELSKFERDHALNQTEELLDKQLELQEKANQEEKDALEDKLENARELYERALEDIKNGSVELYEQMIEWNAIYGDGIDDTIKTAWEEATKALEEYYDTFEQRYKDFNLSNATGYQKPTESWDTSVISGTNPNNIIKPKEPTSSDSESITNPYGLASNASRSLRYDEKNRMKGDDVKALQYALNELGYGNSGTQSIDGSFGKGTDSAVRAFQSANGLVVDGSVGPATRAKLKALGYASGTRNALPGIHAINELGAEDIFMSSNGTQYKLFSGGEKVLNAKATNFLYDFANFGSKVLGNMSGGAVSSSLINAINGSSPVQIKTGDIIINGNADSQTVSEIRRAQRESVDFMLKQFAKLQK